jgi:co-chaperonin GroES (HSP10)
MIPIKPTGYRILLKQLEQKRQTESGILLFTDEEADRQQHGHNLCKVVAMGPACYKKRSDGSEFDEGPWCGVGDYVYISNYGGKMVSPMELMHIVSDEATKNELLEMKDKNLHFHIINDEDVQGVIS